MLIYHHATHANSTNKIEENIVIVSIVVIVSKLSNRRIFWIVLILFVNNFAHFLAVYEFIIIYKLCCLGMMCTFLRVWNIMILKVKKCSVGVLELFITVINNSNFFCSNVIIYYHAEKLSACCVFTLQYFAWKLQRHLEFWRSVLTLYCATRCGFL